MDTSPAKSATVLWARLRLSLVKYRKGRFRRLVESVKHVRNFAEKFSISDFGTAAAIVSAAEIRLGEDRGLDSYFDQSAKFAEWLRSINNPDNDELCIRFLVKVSTTYSSFVSTFPRLPPLPSDLFSILTLLSSLSSNPFRVLLQVLSAAGSSNGLVERQDLMHLLENVDSKFAHTIIDDIMDSVFHLQDIATSSVAHQARPSVFIRENDQRTGIKEDFLFTLLRRDPDVATFVRNALKTTFGKELKHVYVTGAPAPDQKRKSRVALMQESFERHGCWNSCKHCSAAVKRWFSGAHSGVAACLATWCALLAAFVGRYFQWKAKNGPNVDDDIETSVAVAKAAGFAILIATCFIYLTKLPMFAWLRVLPTIWNNTTFHAHCGVGLTLFTIVHVAAHFTWQGKNAFTTKTDNSTADVSSVYDLSAAWLTGTGLVMTVIIFAIALTATRRRQQPANYRRFLNVHYLYYIYLPVLIMHVPYRIYVLGAVLGLFILHEIIKAQLTATGNLAKCSLIGTSTSRLLMDMDAKWGWNLIGSMPGSYYKIKIPALSSVEWHPFSLVTSRSGIQPEFFVEALGKWTSDLKTLMGLPAEELKTVEMQFQGPFYAPAVNVVGEKRPICVAAGIGITPFLGIIHHYVAKHASVQVERKKEAILHNRRKHLEQKRRHGSKAHADARDSVEIAVSDGSGSEGEMCKIIWVVRDLTLANFVLPYVADLLSQQRGGVPLVNVEIFCTGGGSSSKDAMNTMAMNALLLYHFGESGRSTTCMAVTLGRPNLDAELKAANGTAAFYCGGPGLLRRLDASCQKLNLPLHPEEFQNRTLSEWPSCCAKNPKSSQKPSLSARKEEGNGKANGGGLKRSKEQDDAFEKLMQLQIEKTAEVTAEMLLMKKEFAAQMRMLTASVGTPLSAQRQPSSPHVLGSVRERPRKIRSPLTAEPTSPTSPTSPRDESSALTPRVAYLFPTTTMQDDARLGASTGSLALEFPALVSPTTEQPVIGFNGSIGTIEFPTEGSPQARSESDTHSDGSITQAEDQPPRTKKSGGILKVKGAEAANSRKYTLGAPLVRTAGMRKHRATVKFSAAVGGEEEVETAVPRMATISFPEIVAAKAVASALRKKGSVSQV